VVLGTAPLTREQEALLGESMAARLSQETQDELAQVDGQIRNVLERMESDPEQNARLTPLTRRRLALVDPAYHWNPETSQHVPDCSFDFPSFLSSKTALWSLIEEGEISRLLGQIQVPVTAFHGIEDVIPCEAILSFLEQHVPQFQAHRIARAGHFLWLEPQARSSVLERLRAVLEQGG
jgi:pimeloyl-ACP methyl ester carboxylesterase